MMSQCYGKILSHLSGLIKYFSKVLYKVKAIKMGCHLNPSDSFNKIVCLTNIFAQKFCNIKAHFNPLNFIFSLNAVSKKMRNPLTTYNCFYYNIKNINFQHLTQLVSANNAIGRNVVGSHWLPSTVRTIKL